MTKRRVILVVGVCFSMAVFAVRTLSQTGGSNQTAKSSGAERRRNRTEAEKKREAEQRLKKEKLEHERRHRESKKRVAEQEKQWESGAEERKKKEEEWQKEVQEAGGFINEKYALVGLGVTEEQWELIKPKLERVQKQQNLRELERSTSGVRMGGSSSSGTSSKANSRPSEPRWQWKRPWKDKPPTELSEGQKIAEELIALLDKRNATPEQFKQKMDALRRARIAEESKKQRRQKELSEAKQELREGLTARQEAALVLLGWL